MAEISELEQRIKQALDEIDAGLEGLRGGGGAEVQEALEAEKMANAQLEERIRQLKEQHEAQIREVAAAAEDRVSELQAQVTSLTQEAREARGQVTGLRQSSQRLQAALQTLREAGSVGVEPHQLNHAMMSEIEALRAARRAETLELDEILGTLRPMLEGTQNA